MAVGPANIGGSEFLRPAPLLQQTAEDDDRQTGATEDDAENNTVPLEAQGAVGRAAEANRDNVVAAINETTETTPANADTGQDEDRETLGGRIDVSA